MIYLVCIQLFLFFIVFLPNCHAFRMYKSSPSLVACSSSSSSSSSRRSLMMTSTDDISSYVRNGDYSVAFDIIKKNPMIPIGFVDAIAMLNNIDKLLQIEAGTTPDEVRSKMIAEATSLLYKRLQRQKVLRGFGCVEKDNYPEKLNGEFVRSYAYLYVYLCCWVSLTILPMG